VLDLSSVIALLFENDEGEYLLVEHSDRSCNSDNDERLAGYESEYHRSEDGGKKYFIDTVLHVRLGEHVE
jgi:hypothetical protein